MCPDYVTHVEIPSERLREYGLTLREVADIIEASSEDIPAGDVDASSGQILLRMKARKQWAEEFGRIEIVNSMDGGSVTLGDLATKIEDGFEEGGFHGQFNQTPSVELRIYRIGDQSPLEIARGRERGAGRGPAGAAAGRRSSASTTTRPATTAIGSRCSSTTRSRPS